MPDADADRAGGYNRLPLSAPKGHEIRMGPRDYCPCESGKRIEQCTCAVGSRFVPPVAMVRLPGAPTGFRHPNCYLKFDENCSPQISREHFISESILELIQIANGKLMVEGFPWLRGATALPPNALASKVLCKRHNEALSPLDSVALRFYRRLSTAHEHLRHPRGRRDKVYLFNGPDFERWLLKVLCGLLASRNAMDKAGSKIEIDPPLDWCRVLLGQRQLPAHLGLYVTSQVGDPLNMASGIGFGPALSDEGAPVGALAKINGLDFALTLARVLNPTGTVLDGAVHRPREITLNGVSCRVVLWLAGEGWNGEKGIQIDWSDRPFNP
jgi:hypothetical protein